MTVEKYTDTVEFENAVLDSVNDVVLADNLGEALYSAQSIDRNAVGLIEIKGREVTFSITMDRD